MSTYTSYGTTEGAAKHCQHITPSGTWEEETSPAPAYVREWLEEAYDAINARLALRGYTMPHTTITSIAYKELARLCQLYAAGMAERSWGISRSIELEETRADKYLKQFEDGLKVLEDEDVDGTLLGLERADSTVQYGYTVAALRDDDFADTYTGAYGTT